MSNKYIVSFIIFDNEPEGDKDGLRKIIEEFLEEYNLELVGELDIHELN